MAVARPNRVGVYANFEQYPLNLVPRGLRAYSLVVLIKELQDRRSIILNVGNPGNEGLNIFVRDVDSYGSTRSAYLSSDNPLKNWLEGRADMRWVSNTGPSSFQMTEADPRCRFVFLTTTTDCYILPLNLKSLKRLFSFHQISPNFIPFLDIHRSSSTRAHSCSLRSSKTTKTRLTSSLRPSVTIWIP
ncbi:hypothetical protein F4810DRAFT_427535 [Camillea tinctor]|nr:hypothetical protein F4810DRAFT_427535 [Camillea tinctor]